VALIDLLLLQQERHLGTKASVVTGSLAEGRSYWSFLPTDFPRCYPTFRAFGAQAWAPPLLADAVVDISADSPHG
jgi:hypothetical protein